MAWIESHQEIKDNPKTIRLARRLNVEVPHVIGYLHCLWWWATSYAQDGTLYRYDNLDIAYAMMWKGDPDELVEALKTERFLDVDENGLIIHDWYEYAGKLLERRKNDSERKRNAVGKSTDIPRNGRGTSTETPQIAAGTSTEDFSNSTVHNSTVHNSTKEEPLPASPIGDGVTSDTPEDSTANGQAKRPTAQQRRFEEFWELYPNKKSKQDAVKAWSKIKPDEALFAKIMKAIRAQMQSEEWCKENGRYIPHPATWLNGGRWDDVVKLPSESGIKETPTTPPQAFKPSTGGRTFDEYRSDDPETT